MFSGSISLVVAWQNWSVRKNNPQTQHYGDVIMGAVASQITSLANVYSTVYSDTEQRKHLSSASLAFVRGIHRTPVNSPHRCPVTRKMFPFDDVIMKKYMRSMGPNVITRWILDLSCPCNWFKPNCRFDIDSHLLTHYLIIRQDNNPSVSVTTCHKGR